jgi:hypothetical protein
MPAASRRISVDHAPPARYVGLLLPRWPAEKRSIPRAAGHPSADPGHVARCVRTLIPPARLRLPLLDPQIARELGRRQRRYESRTSSWRCLGRRGAHPLADRRRRAAVVGKVASWRRSAQHGEDPVVTPVAPRYAGRAAVLPRENPEKRGSADARSARGSPCHPALTNGDRVGRDGDCSADVAGLGVVVDEAACRARGTGGGSAAPARPVLACSDLGIAPAARSHSDSVQAVRAGAPEEDEETAGS